MKDELKRRHHLRRERTSDIKSDWFGLLLVFTDEDLSLPEDLEVVEPPVAAGVLDPGGGRFLHLHLLTRPGVLAVEPAGCDRTTGGG